MILGTGARPGPATSGARGRRCSAGSSFGALGGLLHAVATVTFGVNHIVSGVAITLLAPGVTKYLATLVFTADARGNPRESPPSRGSRVLVPGLSDGRPTLENQQRFVVSDVAGLLGGLVTGLSPLIVIAFLLVPVSYYVLWRTRFGLRLRSCGENPVAAESLGVNVYRYKYVGVVVSGALAGFGGAAWCHRGSGYLEGQTGGRGYIGLAAMIFGNWRPGGLPAARGCSATRTGCSCAAVAGGARAALRPAIAAVAVVWRSTSAAARCAAAVAWSRAAVLRRLVLRRSTTVPRESRRTPRTSSRCWCSPSRRSDCGCPTADGVRYRRGAGRMSVGRPTGRRCGAAARAAMRRAYAPYSRLPGRRRRRSSTTAGSSRLQRGERLLRRRAVRRVRDGRGSCALTGGGRLVAVACRSRHGELLMPCGRCRQVLCELGGPDCLVDTPRGIAADERRAARRVRPDDLATPTASAHVTRSVQHAVDVIRAKRDGERADATSRSTGWSTPTPAATSRTSRCPRWPWRSCSTAWTRAEIARWTAAMIASGERMDFSGVWPPDRGQALHRRRRRQDHPAARAAGGGLRGGGAAAVRARSRAHRRHAGQAGVDPRLAGARCPTTRSRRSCATVGAVICAARRRPRPGRPQALRAARRHRHRRVDPADRQLDHEQEDRRGHRRRWCST